jgi:hypothetical protein
MLAGISLRAWRRTRSGTRITTGDTITVRLERRAYSPVLRNASLPAGTQVSWWGGRTLRYEYA